MSLEHPLPGCLAMGHNAVDCEAAGLDMDTRCASCWIQTVERWDEGHARKLVQRDMVYDGDQFDPVEEQTQAGLAFLRGLWRDKQ